MNYNLSGQRKSSSTSILQWTEKMITSVRNWAWRNHSWVKPLLREISYHCLGYQDQWYLHFGRERRQFLSWSHQQCSTCPQNAVLKDEKNEVSHTQGVGWWDHRTTEVKIAPSRLGLTKRPTSYAKGVSKSIFATENSRGEIKSPLQIRAQVEIRPQNNLASYTSSWRAPAGMPPQIMIVRI